MDNNTKCVNYEICGNSYPKNYHECWDGTCMNCDMNFGEWKNDGSKGLKFIDNIECCVCTGENLRGVIFPKCEHYTCIKCFKEMWKAILNPDDYELIDSNGIKWSNSCPIKAIPFMVIRMKEKDRKAETCEDVDEFYKECLEDKKLYESENLRKCPLCRK